MTRSRTKCIARGQSTQWCDGCKRFGGRCPARDKFRELRHSQKQFKKQFIHEKDSEG